MNVRRPEVSVHGEIPLFLLAVLTLSLVGIAAIFHGWRSRRKLLVSVIAPLVASVAPTCALVIMKFPTGTLSEGLTIVALAACAWLAIAVVATFEGGSSQGERLAP